MFAGIFVCILLAGCIYLIILIHVTKSPSKIDVIRSKQMSNIELSTEENFFKETYEEKDELDNCLESMVYSIYCGENPFENYILNNELKYHTKEECITEFEKLLNNAGYYKK